MSGFIGRLRGFHRLPFDMFKGRNMLDAASMDREARRARRLESIYHVGQDRIWDGREVLASLLETYGPASIPDRERKALSRIFSIIMWGERAA